MPPCPFNSLSYLALGVLQNHYWDPVPDPGGGCPPQLAWASAGGGDLQSFTSRVTPQSRWLQLWWACLPSYDTLDSQAWRISSPLEVKPAWTSVSLQVITFSEIWGRECWWFSSAFWLSPYAGLGPVEAKVNGAHLRRECLETSAQVCVHFPVELSSFSLWSWSQKWSPLYKCSLSAS